MRTSSEPVRLSALALALASSALAAPTAHAAPQANRSPQQLQALAAPIALFPDPLLAQVLAASNYPGPLHQAREIATSGGVAAQTVALQWPGSVQTLVALPDLLVMLDSRQEWLMALNQAAHTQGPALLGAMQELRRAAKTSGALVNSPAIAVVTQGQALLIEPADAARIPVPTYQPQQVFGGGEAPANAVAFSSFLATSAIVDPIGIDWNAGRLTNGFGDWYSGEIGHDNRGNPTASGTYFVAGSTANQIGYDGTPWRPNGTVVYPGSISTQGHALEPTPWLPPVAPTQPLAPARPIAPIRPLAPRGPIAPRAPVQPTSFVPPTAPLRPISPVPSNIPGVYSPLPWGIAGDGPTLADSWFGGSAFAPGGGGWNAGVRGGSSAASGSASSWGR